MSVPYHIVLRTCSRGVLSVSTLQATFHDLKTRQDITRLSAILPASSLALTSLDYTAYYCSQTTRTQHRSDRGPLQL